MKDTVLLQIQSDDDMGGAYEAKCRKLGDQVVLSYEDGQNTQLLKLFRDHMTLTKRGEMEMHMEFAPGQRYPVECKTAYGTVGFNMETQSFRYEETDGTIRTAVCYLIDYGQGYTDRRRLSLTLTCPWISA